MIFKLYTTLIILGIISFIISFLKNEDNNDYVFIKKTLVGDIYNIEDFINDVHYHKRIIKKLLLNPLFSAIFIIVLILTISIRIIQLFIACVWVLWFFIKYGAPLYYYTYYPPIELGDNSYDISFKKGYVKTTIIIFIIIPKYASFCFFYGLLKSLLYGFDKKNYNKILYNYFIIVIFGTNHWNILFSIVITEEIIISFKYNKKVWFTIWELPRIIESSLTNNFNLFMRISKKLRIYKDADGINFNPPRINAQMLASSANNTTGSLVNNVVDIWSKSRNETMVHHPGFRVLPDGENGSQMAIQLTGNPLSYMKTVEYMVVSYKYNTMHAVYNTSQDRKAIEYSNDMSCRRRIGIESHEEMLKFLHTKWLLRLIDKKAGIVHEPFNSKNKIIVKNCSYVEGYLKLKTLDIETNSKGEKLCENLISNSLNLNENEFNEHALELLNHYENNIQSFHNIDENKNIWKEGNKKNTILIARKNGKILSINEKKEREKIVSIEKYLYNKLKLDETIRSAKLHLDDIYK